MSRYIDADAYIEKYECCGYLDEISVERFNEITPTADVVEVVRCKECENWDTDWITSTFRPNAHYCVVLDNVFDGDFFCACGERRFEDVRESD